MSNIIKFPGPAREAPAARPEVAVMAPAVRVVHSKEKSSMSVMGVIQMVVVMLWPLLKWIVAIDVAWQFARMLYHWHTPGVYGGWTFLLHFGVLTGLTYFVGVYKPKGGL